MKTEYKKSKLNDKYVGIIPFEFEESKNATVDIPDVIHLIPIGEWMHDMYGPMIINNADIREFAQNFNAGVRKGVFITAGHEGFQELPAVGWLKEVEVRGDGLWGTVEWNSEGKEALSDKQWKFFSPELCRDYEDPETHDLYRNVLTGGALTKSPYFKELQAIVFSDKNIKSNFNDINMDLKTLLEKDIATLEDAEKAFIKEHASELTDEQKVSHADVIKEETPAETEEEETARLEKEAGDANEAAGLNRDGSAKQTEEQAMSEKNGMVTMPKAMFSALELKANQGAEAFKELEKSKLDSSVATLTFSASNKEGRFLPKSAAPLRAFMEKLNQEQRTAFSALIKEMPKTEIFNEKGDNNATIEASTMTEVDKLVEAKMAANPTMAYSEALKAVFGENAGLEQRYNDGLPAVKGKN